jgi:hypothetical protein
LQQQFVKFEKEFFMALTIRQVRHFIATAEPEGFRQPLLVSRAAIGRHRVTQGA